jgi:hypothetical protein
MTHYDVLGISRDASKAEVESAFKKEILKHHPDHGGDPEKARRVIEARRVLRDPNRRRDYDATLPPPAAPKGKGSSRRAVKPRSGFREPPFLDGPEGLEVAWPAPASWLGTGHTVPVVTPAGVMLVKPPPGDSRVRLRGAGLPWSTGGRGDLIVTFMRADSPGAPILRRAFEGGDDLGLGGLEAECRGLRAAAVNQVREYLQTWTLHTHQHEANSTGLVQDVPVKGKTYRFHPFANPQILFAWQLQRPCRHPGCHWYALEGGSECLGHAVGATEIFGETLPRKRKRVAPSRSKTTRSGSKSSTAKRSAAKSSTTKSSTTKSSTTKSSTTKRGTSARGTSGRKSPRSR